MRSTPFLLRAYNLFKGGEQNVHASYNCMSTIEIEHALIHDGKGFGLSKKLTVAAGATKIITIDPASVEAHLRVFDFNSTLGPCDVDLWEGSVVGVGSEGTAIPGYNKHRNHANTPDLVIKEDGVLTTSGTLLEYALIEAATGGPIKAAGGSAGAPPIETILNTANLYALGFTNNNASSATVGLKMFWLEP